MITLKRLKQALSFRATTGIFYWRISTSNRVSVGDKAGSVSCGYIRMSIDGKDYLAHRLAWFYVYGEWPKMQIDHINGVRGDNRIKNLREATASINIQNQRNAQPHNKAGFLGVYFDRGKYKAQIRANGSPRHLGRFITAEDAHRAYVIAKRRLHPGCTL